MPFLFWINSLLWMESYTASFARPGGAFLHSIPYVQYGILFRLHPYCRFDKLIAQSGVVPFGIR